MKTNTDIISKLVDGPGTPNEFNTKIAARTQNTLSKVAIIRFHSRLLSLYKVEKTKLKRMIKSRISGKFDFRRDIPFVQILLNSANAASRYNKKLNNLMGGESEIYGPNEAAVRRRSLMLTVIMKYFVDPDDIPAKCNIVPGWHRLYSNFCHIRDSILQAAGGITASMHGSN